MHIFNLFKDYPHELTDEQKKIFDEKEPFWADFFKDRVCEHDWKMIQEEFLHRNMVDGADEIYDLYECTKCGTQESMIRKNKKIDNTICKHKWNESSKRKVWIKEPNGKRYEKYYYKYQCKKCGEAFTIQETLNDLVVRIYESLPDYNMKGYSISVEKPNHIKNGGEGYLVFQATRSSLDGEPMFNDSYIVYDIENNKTINESSEIYKEILDKYKK